jgi:DeoR/GlpR family transcriptional regulator of sugar metabolism
MSIKSDNWTFITNHGLTLVYLFQNPSHTAREIADYLGITERTIHKIIKDLEDASYIARTRNGRKNLYSINHHVPLRHHTKQDILIADLLHALGNN